MKKRKKPRPRLHQGDRVKVVRVPETYRMHLGKTGVVSSLRRKRGMWEVKLRHGISQFFRHELKKLKKR